MFSFINWDQWSVNLFINGISEPILKILTDFLKSQKQQIVLYVQLLLAVMFFRVFHKDPFLAPFRLWFMLMIYLTVFSIIQNWLQMILHYFQLCMILTRPQNRLSNGKWELIQISLSRLKKFFFPQKF